MQRFVDELVGHVGSVELSGVDVIHAGIDSASEYRQGTLAIPWGSEDPGSGELHGAEAHAVNGTVREKDGIAGHGVHIGSPGPHLQRAPTAGKNHEWFHPERRHARWPQVAPERPPAVVQRMPAATWAG